MYMYNPLPEEDDLSDDEFEGNPGDDGDSSGNDGMMMGMVVEIVTLMGEEGRMG